MSEDVGTKLKFWADWHGDKETADTFREAIKEIERLRAENERLREALIEIKNADPVDMALDPQWPSRIAKHALDKVEE